MLCEAFAKHVLNQPAGEKVMQLVGSACLEVEQDREGQRMIYQWLDHGESSAHRANMWPCII